MEKPTSGADLRRRRRSKNLALAVVLGVLVALFYAITIVRMGGN
jgi:high-affinity Fe2+/Pb2+ permease